MMDTCVNTLKLTAILRVGWILGVIGFKSIVMEVIFDLVNSLQGLFVFLCFVVTQKDSKDAVTKFRNRNEGGNDVVVTNEHTF